MTRSYEATLRLLTHLRTETARNQVKRDAHRAALAAAKLAALTAVDLPDDSAERKARFATEALERKAR